MILHKGNMFDVWGKTDMFLFTSNPIVNKQGLAVMGRGIAKQLADKCPTIRKDFAERMADMRQAGGLLHCNQVGEYDGQYVGWFMVKSHWAENAKLEIIKRSVNELDWWLEMTDAYDKRIDLNFPGIGNGKLKREEVLPIIEALPDNVHIWEYGE